MKTGTADSHRAGTDRAIALCTGLLALLVYILTLAPTVSFWDSGEYIACSWIAGIPHPPGVPLFVLLGRFSTILFSFIPSVAVRVNLLCALSGAATVGLLTRLVQRWGNRIGLAPQWYRPMSVLSGLIAAFSYSIWRNSNATETYATALLLTFIIMWSFDCWIEKYAEREHRKGWKDHGGWGEARYLLLISYLLILAVANHGSVPLVTGPPILIMYLIYAFRRKTDIWKRSWFVLTILGLAVLAFSIHLYMPLRAVQRPEINEVDARRWSSFEKAFTREQYGRTSILDRKGPFPDQLKLYMKYLSWQPGRVVGGWDRLLGFTAGSAAAMAMRIVLIFGAIYGLVVLGMRRPKLLLYLGLLFLMSSILFIFLILNFKTGPEGTPAGEVRERDYFFGASFALFAIFSGIGLVSIFRDFFFEKSRLAWLTLAVPALMFTVNHHRCDRSGSYFARDYGINLLQSVPEGAVLITNGDNDTFPLWFAQTVLGVRRDVIVSNLSLMNTDWYVQQLTERDPLLLDYGEMGLVDRLRPVYIWGPHHFHVTRGGMPGCSPIDGEILRATFDQSWPWAITDGTTAIALPSEGVSSQGVLTMQEMVLLNMIRNRPRHGREIYFAGTVAIESRQLLEHYQEMEGIAFRITSEPVVDAVNGPRGWELMNGYLFTGVDDPSVWKCDQTVQLLKNYVSAYHRLAHHYLASGEPDSVRMALDRARELFVTVPDDWAEVLPSRAMIIGRLVDGLEGPAAAADTLKTLADELMAEAERLGDNQLAELAITLSRMAVGSEGTFGYRQEMEYRQLFDSLDDGSDAFAWMRIEVSLMFNDHIGAWRIQEGMGLQEDPLSPRLRELAAASLAGILGNSSFGTRMSIEDTGLFVLFDSMDPNHTGGIRLEDRVRAGDVLPGIIRLASRGRLMSAVSAALVLSANMENPSDREFLRGFAVRMLDDPPADSRRWAEWYLTERNRVPPDAIAWMAARGRRPELMLAALYDGGHASGRTIDLILDDPAAYAASVPRPGTGTGAYSWVNSLIGER